MSLRSALLLFLRALLALCAGSLAWTAGAAEDFLPPEQAFRFEARALDERTVEVAFTVAEGYYLYREPFKFAADGATLGTVQLPAGKVKFDETFQKDVETYRKRLVIRVPVSAAPATFRLNVTSQGCADQGLCYPPMVSRADVRLAGFGGDGSVRLATAATGTAGALGSGGIPSSSVAAIGGSTASNMPDDVTLGSAGTGATGSAVQARSGDAAIDDALRAGSFGVVLGVFFVAGLLLSFTPCVLPMLPILSSLIAGQGGDRAVSRARGLALAAAYSLGMALVYTALGVAAGLAGEGLAAALQKPWVLGSFALLLTLLALSMFGAYELQLPAAWQQGLSGASHRLRGGRLAAVFAMGGLSALIVSPCVAAPLAGALLYISQTRDVVLGGSALFALAAGMSVPLLLLGASAGALLPRAGAWMETIKRCFGVLLLAVAWWMLQPLLAPVLAVAGWGLLLLFAATLLHAFDRLPEAAGAGARMAKAGGLALGLIGAVQIVGAAAGADDPMRPLQPFARAPEISVAANSPSPMSSAALEDGPRASPNAAAPDTREVAGLVFKRVATLAELDTQIRAAQRPVLLDFYADWCVSCKEMERYTFTDAQVRSRLQGSLLLQADVTRNTPDDRALLKRFELFGPPGIVFFDPSGNELRNVRVIGYQKPDRFLQSLQAAGL